MKMLSDIQSAWVMLILLWVEASVPSCVGGAVDEAILESGFLSFSQVTTRSPGV